MIDDMSSLSDGHDSAGFVPETKRPYQSPKLSVYGDIRDITRATNSMSMMKDGAMGMMMADKTAG